ncbi:hypothetical protein A3D45_03075 [Candidatus Falkowbacteria bacterium RIFCSPHIGHO2_02_FULL_42_9]|uniref:Uncharacterized protein n=1 Tax=Candidatus Falkowbacteria bacterium RIFCSPHIGHO2_02_FULL_42_9 TaxID=1797986 RepID=A0A1F5S9A8_9BACT|nr:MAG: hypothetical protein A3D45_03075 [Candidatus Falkowbacteria bacterium RIFCSPHIGHO2_02_FULL_42_9]
MKRVQDALNGLKVPGKTQDFITEGLRLSFNLKRNTEDVIKQNLEIKKNSWKKKWKFYMTTG